MMNCKQATRLLSAAQERPLSLGERLSLRLHTSLCAGCRNFGQQMGSLRQIARSYSRSDVGDASDGPDSEGSGHQ